MLTDITLAAARDLPKCRATALAHGLEQALAELHQRVRSTAALVGQHGYSMLPPSLHDLLPTSCEIIATQATDTGELIIARSGPESGESSAPWWTGVAWIRLGGVERLNKQATDRLTDRKVQGRPTITLPLVRVSVGDVAAAVAEARYLLADTPDEDKPRIRGRFDEIVDFAVRTSLKLFGASGYVVGPPSNLAYAITRLGEVYAGIDPKRIR